MDYLSVNPPIRSEVIGFWAVRQPNNRFRYHIDNNHDFFIILKWGLNLSPKFVHQEFFIGSKKGLEWILRLYIVDQNFERKKRR